MCVHCESCVQQAERWLERIEAQCQELAEVPGMGRVRPELPGSIRSFGMQRYVILYRQIPDGVEIVCVLHSSRDLGNIDFGSP
jgi:toxin ParE1/3/4